nr:uncharacterized protein LOC109786285 [Aegilops tauschii subsp. strangulata]
MPSRLVGCCYNCGEPDHISRKCTNETICVRCNSVGHHSRDCKRPRSPSLQDLPPRLPPALRGRLVDRRQLETASATTPASASAPLPLGPPPAGTVRIVRSWARIVEEGSAVNEAGSATGASVGSASSSHPASLGVVEEEIS